MGYSKTTLKVLKSHLETFKLISSSNFNLFLNRKFHQISTESTSDTSDNNNNISSKSTNITVSSRNLSSTKPTNAKKPPRAPFLSRRNKTMSSFALNSASTSSSSKLNHSVSHVVLKNPRAAPKSVKKSVPFTMVKSKSDLMSLKSYPESFTIVTSPKRSPSAGYCESKRRKTCDKDEDDDEMMDYEWIKPPAAKLYEAAQAAEAIEDIEKPPCVNDIFGQQIVRPTTPILTDKVMIGSSHR